MDVSPSGSKLDRFVTKYRQDHTHPVNHFLHLGVGWPMVALAVLLLPIRPWWSLGPTRRVMVAIGGRSRGYFGPIRSINPTGRAAGSPGGAVRRRGRGGRPRR